MNWRDIIV